MSNAPPSALVAAVYQPLNEHLEVFVVDVTGELNVIWKEHNNNWNPPFPLTGAGFAKPGASIAAVYYPTNQNLEVFVVDRNGVFNVIWKEHDGVWHAPVGLTSAGFAPSGAPLAAVYQPLNEHLEVFVIDANGALNVIWKEHNNNWNPPFPLTGADFAKRGGASIAAVYYPMNENLEVFAVNNNGAFAVAWKEHDGIWHAPVEVTEQQFSSPGAPLAAVYYPLDDHLEAFTTDRAGAVCVEWKVKNQAWVPCPYPILGTPAAPVAGPANLPIVLRTERLGQLTGSQDPEGKPVLNSTDSGEWRGAGVEGVDLGANTEHKSTLFFFFGDVPRGSRTNGPDQDADLVGWTADSALRPGGFTLHPVKSGQYFDPFTVDHGIGILPTDRTPTGAFSYALPAGARAYVFGLWDDPLDPPFPNTNVRLPTTILTSKEDPTQPGPYHLEFTFSKHKFWQVAPVVVQNADHDLPERNGDGLVLFGGGEGNAVYLAWMRLDPSFGPMLNSVRYYIGGAQGRRWSEPGTQHEPEAKSLFSLNPVYTSVSAAWLTDAKQWIVLYSNAFFDPAHSRMDPARPAVARFGTNPWTWSDEVQIFNPCRDLAYGHFMHWSGLDDIDSRVPPAWGDDRPGWAYGLFFLRRFTTWNASARELSLAYLMSTSRPYQVQVMRTQLRLP